MIRDQHAAAAVAAIVVIGFLAFLPETTLYDLDPGAADRAWWLKVLLGFSAAAIGAVVSLSSALAASSLASAIGASLAFLFGATFTAQASLVDSTLPMMSLVAVFLAPAIFVLSRVPLPATPAHWLPAYAPLVAGAALAVFARLLFASETGTILRADIGLLGIGFAAAGSAAFLKDHPVAGGLLFAVMAIVIGVAAAGAPGALLAASATTYVLIAAGMGWFLRATNASAAALLIVSALPAMHAVGVYLPARSAMAAMIVTQAAGKATVPQPLLPDYLDRLPRGSIVIAGFGGETASHLAGIAASPFTRASGASWSSPPAPFYGFVGVVGFDGIDQPFERNASLAVDLRVDAGDPIGRTRVISPVPIRVLSDAAGVIIDAGRRWIVRTHNGVGLVILSPAGDVVAVHRLEARAPFVVPAATTEPLVSDR